MFCTNQTKFSPNGSFPRLERYHEFPLGYIKSFPDHEQRIDLYRISRFVVTPVCGVFVSNPTKLGHGGSSPARWISRLAKRNLNFPILALLNRKLPLDVCRTIVALMDSGHSGTFNYNDDFELFLPLIGICWVRVSISVTFDEVVDDSLIAPLSGICKAMPSCSRMRSTCTKRMVSYTRKTFTSLHAMPVFGSPASWAHS